MSTSEKDLVQEIVHFAAAINKRKSETVNENSNLLTQLDFDSLQMLELFTAIEKRFQVNLIAAQVNLAEVKTPGEIARLVMELRPR